MAYQVEIISRFSEYRDCDEYVYSHLDGSCALRTTRLYSIRGRGSESELGQLVDEVLVDPVSEDWVLRDPEDSRPPDDRADGCLDVYLKPGVLDLEKQYLLEYFEAGTPGDFQVEDLTIMDRYYLRVETGFETVLETVVGDLVNPVIHDWTVSRFETNGVS